MVQVLDRRRARGARAQLSRESATGRFCHGDVPTLADICLVPQLANARRVTIDLSPYPTLSRIDADCQALPAFAAAAPERQPDADNPDLQSRRNPT